MDGLHQVAGLPLEIAGVVLDLDHSRSPPSISFRPLIPHGRKACRRDALDQLRALADFSQVGGRGQSLGAAGRSPLPTLLNDGLMLMAERIPSAKVNRVNLP